MSQQFQPQQEVPGQYGGAGSGGQMESDPQMGSGSQMGAEPQVGAGSQMGHQTGTGTPGQQMGSQPMGTQPMGQGGPQTMGQEMGMRLSDVESSQQRVAVEDITRAIQVCGFCADQCVQEADPSMIECIRLCEDVTELGETVLALLPRSSRFSDAVLQTFQQAVDACARECGQHPHGHCQECAEVLGYTSDSIQQLLGSSGQQGGGPGQQTPSW